MRSAEISLTLYMVMTTMHTAASLTSICHMSWQMHSSAGCVSQQQATKSINSRASRPAVQGLKLSIFVDKGQHSVA